MGLLFSSALFGCSYARHSDLLFWPQAAGFYVAILALGVHTATKTGLAMITIPVNAAIYSAVIFGLAKVFVRKRDSH
jgi:hypothetical protein